MAAKTTDFPVKQRQLNDDIKNGTFKRCYLIYGEEAYLRLQNRDKLVKALDGGASSMNFTKYEGDQINPAQVIDMAETMPFLSDKRVILIENSGFFKNGCPELSDYLKKPSETTYFIFVEKEIDKRKDIFKAVSKIGFEMNCDTQDEDTLKRWIAGKFASEGKKISPRAAAFFLERVGTDMSNISTEIEKLVCYCIDKDEITVEDINAVCAGWLTSRIFAMTDAIASQDQKKAIDLYYDLLALKEPPAKILALITRQFNIMLQVKEMSANHKDRAQIASGVGIAPFLVGKYESWARIYSFEELRRALELCAANDEAVKTGKLDYIISVEMVIIGTTRKR
ncbi:DNA polymerase III, delta subunit [Butyrivibrio proteoclasticus]|uniref:DNA polymerase III subunit delta n=1 Tax=Butyrivibrio proteoclasticus TaxID=43305 RepID=A0A1I5R2T9_9FIRM|nr:DNA polymerase III subunit delta [Butyrivibrio proteoclasticus]SFP52838.1 DNA polymerase III, delta subunit [Butyrivibrio proteoclasticus]